MHYLCQMYELMDKELGKIVVTTNIRAKRIIARRKNGYFQLTVPYGFNTKRLKSVLDEMRPRLLKATAEKIPKISEHTVIDAFSFTAGLRRTHLAKNVQMNLKNGELTVFIPHDFDLEKAQSQHIVKEAIKAALRHEAKRILPQKTMFFAQKFNLQVSDVKINKSTSRWGSCSRKKNINFSLYLMLLPEKYIDYVVLHELAHTVELNHSEKFWKLLDRLCGEDAKAISRSLRKYKSTAYELLKP